VIWFFVLGHERRVSETRLALEGDGYELIVSDSSGNHVEHFTELPKLLAREHELVAAWRAQGWRPTTVKVPALPTV
jgi:hypothetical protein